MGKGTQRLLFDNDDLQYTRKFKVGDIVTPTMKIRQIGKTAHIPGDQFRVENDTLAYFNYHSEYYQKVEENPVYTAKES